jgi:DNA-binding transcriptional ArsR family regulator
MRTRPVRANFALRAGFPPARRCPRWAVPGRRGASLPRIDSPPAAQIDTAEEARLRALQALAEALGHPVRNDIIFAVSDRAQSARQIAERIGEPVRAVRHHLSRLAEAGVVSPAGFEERRGAREKYYVAATAPELDVGEHERLGPRETRRITIEVFRGIVEDVTRALSAGAFDRRSGAVEVLVEASLDERGWQEVAQIFRETYEEVRRLKDEAAGRLERSGEAPISAESVLLFFGQPPPVP